MTLHFGGHMEGLWIMGKFNPESEIQKSPESEIQKSPENVELEVPNKDSETQP